MWSRLRGWLRRLVAREAPPPAAPPMPEGKHARLSTAERIRRYGNRVTLQGEVVQSNPERRIADFLFKKGVRYVYEHQIPGATPDFFLPDSNIILEHWGMDHSKYREKRAMKTRLYLSRGYRLVETEKRDVARLERVLEARLLKADPDIFERARRTRRG